MVAFVRCCRAMASTIVTVRDSVKLKFFGQACETSQKGGLLPRLPFGPSRCLRSLQQGWPQTSSRSQGPLECTCGHSAGSLRCGLRGSPATPSDRCAVRVARKVEVAARAFLHGSATLVCSGTPNRAQLARVVQFALMFRAAGNRGPDAYAL